MYEVMSLAPLLGATSQGGPDPRQEPCQRKSSPASGRTLGGAVTAVERPVRQAIAKLGRAVAVDKDTETQLFGCTVYGPGAHVESFDIRLAWFLVTTVLVHAWKFGYASPSTFSSALTWLTGDSQFSIRLLSCYPKRSLLAAEQELSTVQVSADFWDLLPYVLEPHGHITRSELEASDIARATRSTKKSTGVYYTPSDVADFMVACVSDAKNFSGTWLDPACGTGVFLRSIVRHYQASHSDQFDGALNFVQTKLFAIDKSALATDLAAFVLLSDCWNSTQGVSPPFADWQRIKKNIVCMDSLRILPSSSTTDMHGSKSGCATIADAFPSVTDGAFNHLVMNPPYAKVQIDQHMKASWDSYRNIALGGMADTHLGFAEMMWKLAHSESRAVAVLPLSVGTNTTKSFKALREVLFKSAGQKDFLFFDREPQALFGEDIKTRNVVIVRQSGPNISNAVRTSRMLKWTAPQRSRIFRRDSWFKFTNPIVRPSSRKSDRRWNYKYMMRCRKVRRDWQRRVKGQIQKG